VGGPGAHRPGRLGWVFPDTRIARHEEGSNANSDGREERADPVGLRFTRRRQTGWATVAWPLVVLQRVDDTQGTLAAEAEPRCFCAAV